MRGKLVALSAGVLVMSVLAGASAWSGETAETGSSAANGSAKELYRTYDGKNMNLQPRRVASRPPLPRRRPVSLPGRDLADAATLGTDKPGVKPAGGLEPADRTARLKKEKKEKPDDTASGGVDETARGGIPDAVAAPRKKVNFKAKY